MFGATLVLPPETPEDLAREVPRRCAISSSQGNETLRHRTILIVQIVSPESASTWEKMKTGLSLQNVNEVPEEEDPVVDCLFCLLFAFWLLDIIG